MAFQTSVASQQSPGIEGGFYGNNPIFTLTNPAEGMWVAGSAGVTIGHKVYMSYADGSVVSAATGAAATVTRSVTTTNASTTISYTGGAIYAGQPVSGTGIPAGAYIVSVNSGAGTAVLSAAATASGTVTGTFTTNYETAWSVRSTAGNGELAKISVRG